jgi:twinkle protein
MGLSERSRKILEERGLDAELLVRHGVESSDRLGPDCIVIPFIEAGQAVNHKFRTIAGDKKFCQDAGGRKVFWNVDVIADPTLANVPLIITEGEFDAMAAIQAGFARTVSVPMGGPAQEIGQKDSAEYNYLDNAPAALSDVKEIILATDGDEVGTNLLHDLALRLGKARCKWVRYPKGCKDLNDALRTYGEKGVVAAIGRAQWIAMPGLYLIHELPPLPESHVYRLGMPVLDDHYRLRLGDLTVVTGIPGHGKSTLLNEIACRMADRYQWPVMFASFEQRPQTDHLRALRTWFNRKKVIQQTQEEVAAADEWIQRMFSFVVPDEDDEVTLEWVLERCASAAVRYGARLLIIDPWNEMDHRRPPDTTLTEYTGFAIKQFRRIAKKLMVHVIVAAHPVKQRKLDNGDYSVPSLYDISDSAHWYNRADIGLIVHRDRNGTLLRIAKSRHHDEIGTPGDVSVNFCRETGRYEVVDSEDELPMSA